MPNNPSPAVQDSAGNQQNQNEVEQSETQRQPIEVVQQEAEVVQHVYNTRQTRKRKRQATQPNNCAQTTFLTTFLNVVRLYCPDATPSYRFMVCATYSRRGKCKPARIDAFQGRTVDEVANILHSAKIEKQGGNPTTFANLFGNSASNTAWKSAFRDDLTEARRSLILVPP